MSWIEFELKLAQINLDRQKLIQEPILIPGKLNAIGDKSASSYDQRWYVLNSRKHGIKTSKHDPKPSCKKYKKSGQKGAKWGQLH